MHELFSQEDVSVPFEPHSQPAIDLSVSSRLIGVTDSDRAVSVRRREVEPDRFERTGDGRGQYFERTQLETQLTQPRRLQQCRRVPFEFRESESATQHEEKKEKKKKGSLDEYDGIVFFPVPPHGGAHQVLLVERFAPDQRGKELQSDAREDDQLESNLGQLVEPDQRAVRRRRGGGLIRGGAFVR